MLDFKNKTILITGANGFLGTNIVEALLSCGANVIATDTSESASIKRLDICNDSDISNFVGNMKNDGIMLNGIVNNAAISYKGYDIGIDKFRKTMDTNVLGTYNCITLFEPVMSNKSSIVNIASIYGTSAPDFSIYDGNESLFNSSAYGASKAAIIQMTKYYASHFGEKIRVNTVSPGGIWQNHSDDFNNKYSKNVPLKRMASVSEIVAPILFLLSDMSSYITGHNLVVDGGITI